MRRKVLFDDGDIRDEVYFITENGRDKEVAFVHRTEYYSEISIAVELGYERVLHSIPIDGEIKRIEVVKGLQSFVEGSQIGYRWKEKVEIIEEPEEIEAFWSELVDNPDWR